MNGQNLNFHRVVIIESLEDFETKTGKTNAELLSGEISSMNKSTPVGYYSCESAYHFQEMIKDLIRQSSPDNVPLLHVECHGDIEEGLVFENGSSISWPELAKLLFPLNLVTGCGLMLCLSACHAGHFVAQMGNLKVPCPCRVLVAPESAVDPSDCIRGFRIFYMELFSSLQVDIALRRISNTKDNGARWVGEYAENWFKEVMKEYVSTRYSKKAIKYEILKMQKKLEDIGTYKKIGQVKSEYQHYLRSIGLKLIYEKFFGIDVAPEIDQYFSDSYHNMNVWVQRMREAGRIGF